jgi:hypothetical protein
VSTFRRKFANTALALCFLTASATAKRAAPKQVSPVISGGIRYSAEGDGMDEYVLATDASSGKELWKVKVFHNDINPSMEEDVQAIFITNLKLAGNSLSIRDEKSRCYSLDLTTKHVKKQLFCWPFFAIKNRIIGNWLSAATVC